METFCSEFLRRAKLLGWSCSENTPREAFNLILICWHPNFEAFRERVRLSGSVLPLDFVGLAWQIQIEAGETAISAPMPISDRAALRPPKEGGPQSWRIPAVKVVSLVLAGSIALVAYQFIDWWCLLVLLFANEVIREQIYNRTDHLGTGACIACGNRRELFSEPLCAACIEKQRAVEKAEAEAKERIRQAVQRAERQRQQERQQRLSYWKSLDPYDFEKQVAELFSDCGFETRVTKKAGDNGVDVIATKNGKRYAIQCKRYSDAPVGRPVCQQHLGVVVSGRYSGGYIVTTSDFSAPAIEFGAKHQRIKLINGSALIKAKSERRLP
ncbi:MAG: restriction endonuclease [Azonexus sp.]